MLFYKNFVGIILKSSILTLLELFLTAFIVFNLHKSKKKKNDAYYLPYIIFLNHTNSFLIFLTNNFRRFFQNDTLVFVVFMRFEHYNHVLTTENFQSFTVRRSSLNTRDIFCRP